MSNYLLRFFRPPSIVHVRLVQQAGLSSMLDFLGLMLIIMIKRSECVRLLYLVDGKEAGLSWCKLSR
jgi:hypothetical protein